MIDLRFRRTKDQMSRPACKRPEGQEDTSSIDLGSFFGGHGPQVLTEPNLMLLVVTKATLGILGQSLPSVLATVGGGGPMIG